MLLMILVLLVNHLNNKKIISLRDTATKRSQLNIMMTGRVEIAEVKVFIVVNNNDDNDNNNNDEVEGIWSLKTYRCVTKITEDPKLEVNI